MWGVWERLIMIKEMEDWLEFKTDTIPIPANLYTRMDWFALRNRCEQLQNEVESRKNSKQCYCGHSELDHDVKETDPEFEDIPGCVVQSCKCKEFTIIRNTSKFICHLCGAVSDFNNCHFCGHKMSVMKNCEGCGHIEKLHDDCKHECYFDDCTCKGFITEYCKCGHDVFRHNIVIPNPCGYIDYWNDNRSMKFCECKEFVKK